MVKEKNDIYARVLSPYHHIPKGALVRYEISWTMEVPDGNRSICDVIYEKESVSIPREYLNFLIDKDGNNLKLKYKES